MQSITTILLTFSLTALGATARADSTPEPRNEESDSFHVDLEVDPTAYVFEGYSVHLGLGWKNLRLDIGTYAMELPEWIHGNEGWNARFSGVGAKLQWFPLSAGPRGLFVDASAGVSRQTFELQDMGESDTSTVFGVGVAAGYRFALPHNFYATPWAGLSYDLNAKEVMVEGRTFERSNFVPFAAVHVGFQFR